MALHDFRKLIDVGAPSAAAYVAVEVTDRPKPIRLEATMGGLGVVLELDESEAGQLFDAIAGALRTLIGVQAEAKLHEARHADEGR